MATLPQQGIMSLPETDQAAAPSLPLIESYDAAKEGLNAADPAYSQMYDAEMAKIMPTLLGLTDEQLDALLQMVQYLNDHPEEYAQRVQELESEGIIEPGDFPPEYDENFLAVFGAALLEAQKNNEPAAGTAMQPPMAMARGGIAEAARMVASQGRNGDTMLAHITKDEAKLLKKHGGVGTRNPRTGLHEYGLWSSIKNAVKSVGSAVTGVVKGIGNAVKSVLSSTAGKMIATVALATFLGPGAFGITGMGLGSTAAMGLASAGVTALSGGNLRDVIKAGVTGAISGFGAEVLGPAAGKFTGVTNAAGQAAMGAGAAGLGTGLLQGKSIKDSVKEGLTAAAFAGLSTGAQKGFDAQVAPSPNTSVPVEDRFLAPQNAADVNVSPTTGQVAGGAPAQVAPPVQTAATTPDPLGDFMAKQDAFSRAINTPAANPNPTFMDRAADLYNQGADWVNQNIMPSGRQAAAADNVANAYQGAYDKAIAAGKSVDAAKAAADVAAKAATPGIIGTYGPAIGAGLGITALAGGFEPSQPGVPQETKDRMSGKATQDLINANPRAYYTQNLPGVTYDAAGNITGSGAWTPRSGAGTTEVAGNYVPLAPMNSIGMANPQPSPVMQPSPMMQPATTPYGQYDFTPRYAADGGFMQSTGGFPVTPLTAAPGPAMAMQAHSLPMNTPGVAMNMPMGFAMGGMPPQGIASLMQGGYPRRTGQISGPGTETSDDIPAMLSDGEFVMTAKAVRGAGKGNRREGAKKMYALMHRLEKNAARG